MAGLAAECAALVGAPPTRRRPSWSTAGAPGSASRRPPSGSGARLALHTEGLLLDDTYGAEAFAALLDRLPAAGPVVFWHTGGLLPALAHLTEACA